MRETIASILLFIVAVLALGSMIAAIVWLIVLLKKDISSRGGIKKVVEEEAARTKEEIEWMEKCEKARAAWNKIASIRQLTMHFQEIDDWILGKMHVCYEIDEIPLYLKAFKCSMEKKPWNRPEQDEIISVIIFARNVESVIDYMNCYQHKDPDASGFEFWGTNYIYDGMIPLAPCENLMDDIKYAQKAFVIDYATGNDYRRKKAAEAA
jgi:hypothetical protein